MEMSEMSEIKQRKDFCFDKRPFFCFGHEHFSFLEGIQKFKLKFISAHV